MKYIFSFFCFLILQACGPMYSNELSSSAIDKGPVKPSKPGACYAKCLIPDQYGQEPNYYFRYTGDDPDQEGIVESVVESKERSTNWLKKRADKNCMSANPEDCLVWCLVEVPAETLTIVEVLDTVEVKDFVLDYYEVEFLDRKGGFTAWREIVCQKDVTSRLVYDIQASLHEKEYLEVEYKVGKLDKPTKEAIKAFQKDYALPLGALDFETLDALGVRY